MKGRAESATEICALVLLHGLEVKLQVTEICKKINSKFVGNRGENFDKSVAENRRNEKYTIINYPTQHNNLLLLDLVYGLHVSTN